MAELDLLARVARASGQIAQRAAWAEQHGRLHAETFEQLRQIGVGRLYLPTRLGGYAVTPMQCAQVCETLAAADPSAAWYVMVFNSVRLMAASWPEASVEALWADDPDRLVAASGHTPLQAAPSGGGFIISGQNSFVSGCHYAQYMVCPVRVDGRDGEMFSAIVPMDQCEIMDNWDTLGMRGTGSNDVRVSQVEVPGEFVIAHGSERNRYYADRLYACPARVAFATYIPIALALAETAINELAALAQSKVPYAADGKLAHRKLAQQHYAQALALWRSARLYFYTALEEVWELAGRGHQFSVAERADLYLAGTHALQQSALAVRHVIDAAGSSSLHKGSVLERVHRDMEVLRHHGFASESRYANVTQALWGVELEYPLLLR